MATVGGHDTLFVLSEGRGLARLPNLKKWLRVEVAPVTLSWPLALALPAKFRTRISGATLF